MSRANILFLAGLAWGGLVPAQESQSFKISDHVFNAGGETLLSSASFRLQLGAIGEGLIASALTSAGYTADVGFSVGYVPPGEVAPCDAVHCPGPLLAFTDQQTLFWPAEPSVGSYNLYRDLLGNIDAKYGACLQHRILGTTTVDAGTPDSGRVYFYLVTARNRLGEEGPKGFDGAGVPRPNPPSSACP